ncbi:hypothetical protein AB0J72_51030 [Dactylosporangium sp. NPDC049742]|uniref:hypothetical protein n=1 Tax=Dactylosporangium sp. NPDC049742 TaxID=3154737 RepID=UPI00341EDEC9
MVLDAAQDGVGAGGDLLDLAGQGGVQVRAGGRQQSGQGGGVGVSEGLVKAVAAAGA